MSFLEGVHYWEFICPISCDSMGKFWSEISFCLIRLLTFFNRDWNYIKWKKSHHHHRKVHVHDKKNSRCLPWPQRGNLKLLDKWLTQQEDQEQAAKEAWIFLEALPSLYGEALRRNLEALLQAAANSYKCANPYKQASKLYPRQPQLYPDLLHRWLNQEPPPCC